MKKYFVAAGICGLLFIALIIIVKNVDVSAIGPEGTSIGLSGINKDVHEATGLSLNRRSICSYGTPSANCKKEYC